jgi:hypothetical protein
MFTLSTTHISPRGKSRGGLRVELPVGGGLVKLKGGGAGRFGGGIPARSLPLSKAGRC